MHTVMTCPEDTRLRNEYEAAIQEWAKVMRMRDDASGEALFAAFTERTEALSRMTAHIEVCQTCLRDKQEILGGRSA